MWSRIIRNIRVSGRTYIPFSTKKLVPILSYHRCMLQCVFVLHIIHVGDVDSLELCEDSNLDSPACSDMQFTDAPDMQFTDASSP